MFFAAVEGCHHTRNLNRYLLRLAVFALVSWFPFLYFHFGGDLAAIQLMRPNVIYTIFWAFWRSASAGARASALPGRSC